MVEIVKKNYKGNWETYKRHNAIANFSAQNKAIKIDKITPLTSKIQKLKDDPQSYFKYLKLAQLNGNKFEIGDCNKMTTEFCLLNTEDGENIQDKSHLCLTYGSCVILYDDQIKKLCQFEVQKQI